ncbi:MAG: hypothetical protein ACOVSV_10465 [Fimbriimonadaceae bacterium]
MNTLDRRRVLTVKQAAKVAKVYPNTVNRWIQSGFLKVVPKFGREKGDRVLLGEVLDCAAAKRRGASKSRGGTRTMPRDRLWYKRQIAATRFRRLLETAEERERRLAWQREYGRRRRAEGAK